MDTQGNYLKQITQILFEPISKRIKYVTHDREYVLRGIKEAELLESRRLQIEREGELASGNGFRLTKKVEEWLGEAAIIQPEISSLKSEFEERKIFKKYYPKYLSRYKLGKRAFKKIKDLKDIRERSKFDWVVEFSPSPPRVFEMRAASTDGQSTTEIMLEKIWGHLHDEHSRIISLYGVGGIGKTTLMKTIYHRLILTRDFDLVIWINVSKHYNSETLLREILRRSGFHFRGGSREMRSHCRLCLETKRYLLILDGPWDHIRLDQIGIPLLEISNGSKIVMTTRFVGVSKAIEADVKIKLEPLTGLEAWNFFLDEVGEVGLLSDIQPLAEEVVRECAGLPLAVSVVGRAMRGEKKKELWQNALRAMRGRASKIEGMGPQVFLSLKLSYDKLDDKLKMCFLYCSLFPKEYEIDTDELVTYLTMEGLIDNVDNLVEASNKGHHLIKSIIDACLLEEGIKGHKHFVKMQDLIRDFALWITSSSSSHQGPKFLVRAGVDLEEAPQEGMWREAERISLMRNWITRLPSRPNCRNLISLSMRENRFLDVIPMGFFKLMPRLQILDLSCTSIRWLPASFSSLGNLRALILSRCNRLELLPPLEHLKELQFLDLSDSGIIKLPQDMENLVKLKKLNLSYLELRSLPRNVLPKLSNIEDLCIWTMYGKADDANAEKFDEIATLTHLTTLEITVSDIELLAQDVFPLQWSSLKKFKIRIYGLYSNVVEDLPCAKLLQISDVNLNTLGMKVLQMLSHVEGLILSEREEPASQIIRNLDNLSMMQLRMICFRSCKLMKCLIDWREIGVDSSVLQNIEEFHLLDLREMWKLFMGKMPKGITWKLKKIVIGQCHKLRSLFSSEMVKHLDQLEVLHVMQCDILYEIIEGVESLPRNPFPRLSSLKLISLCRLRSIVRIQEMDLPSLIEFYRESCPKLRLPKCRTIEDILSKMGQPRRALMQWPDDREISFEQPESSTARQAMEWEDENEISIEQPESSTTSQGRTPE